MALKRGEVVDFSEARNRQSQDINTLFKQKLASSGLSPRDAKRLNFNLLTKGQVVDLGHPAAPAIRIPYFSPDGSPLPYYRLRYLQDPGGWDRRKKPLRYVQPPNTLPEAYLPPYIKWGALFKDPSRPVVITEGELKAAAATKAGVPTVGLGGVWAWKAGDAGIGCLDVLRRLAQGGRRMLILYDSDASQNPKVLRAEAQLARVLATYGADVGVVRMPALPSLEKTGLDDYLLHMSVKDLHALLETAQPYEKDDAEKALEEMNEMVLFIRDPGLILVRATGQRMSPAHFAQYAYAQHKFVRETLMPNGGARVEECSTAREWLEWDGRAEAQCLAYAPGQPRDTPTGYNTWRGWGAEPRKGDARPWRELLDRVFAGEPDARSWFERWLAYPLQHPGTKMFTAAVLWSRLQATGKTLIGHTLFRIYGENAAEITGEELHAPYNEWAENKQFVLGEEIAGGEGPRRVADRVKAMITRQRIRINPKYVPAYSTDDRVNYLFTSNHPDAFFLEDSDRRFFVHEATEERLPTAFAKKYDAWYRSAAGAGALFYHLLNIPLKGFDHREAAPRTAAKDEMIYLGRSDLAAWVARLARDPDAVLKVGDVRLPYNLYRSEDLLRIYDPGGTTRTTANGMARELTRAGFARPYAGAGVPVPGLGQVRLWIVRNAAQHKKEIGVELGRAYAEERAREARGKKPKI